jgi:hypothetical protein
MAVPVGGTNGLIDRLQTLLGWHAITDTTKPERIDALNLLNYAEKLDDPKFDYSKDHTLRDANGFPLEYCSADEFHRLAAGVDAVFPMPAGYLLAVDDNDAKMKMWLDVAVLANANWTLYGQRVPSALADADISFSLLPEGRELTLLLPIAEQAGKQRKRELDVSMLNDQTRMELEAFYAEQRVNKLTAATDTNSDRRLSERKARHSAGE